MLFHLCFRSNPGPSGTGLVHLERVLAYVASPQLRLIFFATVQWRPAQEVKIRLSMSSFSSDAKAHCLGLGLVLVAGA